MEEMVDLGLELGLVEREVDQGQVEVLDLSCVC
jgi:hypothetical protein